LSGEAQRDPFWTWQDVVLFLLLALPCMLIAASLTKAALFIFHLENVPKGLKELPAEFLFYGLWFPMLALLFRMKYNAPFWKSMHWVYPPYAILPALINGVLLALIVGLLGYLLRTPMIESPMQELMRDRKSAIAVTFLAVTLGPICEELIFRGLLQPLLTRSLGAPLAIVLSAIPFALLHGPQYGWVWQTVVLVTVAGIAFGYVRYKTGSTAIAALTHATYNGTFLFAWFQQKGSTY
jgi:membrane protease YdiL (CAAX protease family)